MNTQEFTKLRELSLKWFHQGNHPSRQNSPEEAEALRKCSADLLGAIQEMRDGVVK